MPRQSKPFFRERTKSWYCSLNGKQYPLGKDKKEASEAFYELMAKRAGFQSRRTESRVRTIVMAPLPASKVVRRIHSAQFSSEGLRLKLSLDASDDIAEENLLSGNLYFGIFAGNDTTSTIIANNLIGTNAAGNAALPNEIMGINIGGSANSRISGNTISGNTYDGLYMDGATVNMRVVRNRIGARRACMPLRTVGSESTYATVPTTV